MFGTDVCPAFRLCWHGIKPVMLAVVLAAVASLAKKALEGTEKVLAGIGKWWHRSSVFTS